MELNFLHQRAMQRWLFYGEKAYALFSTKANVAVREHQNKVTNYGSDTNYGDENFEIFKTNRIL